MILQSEICLIPEMPSSRVSYCPATKYLVSFFNVNLLTNCVLLDPRRCFFSGKTADFSHLLLFFLLILTISLAKSTQKYPYHSLNRGMPWCLFRVTSPTSLHSASHRVTRHDQNETNSWPEWNTVALLHFPIVFLPIWNLISLAFTTFIIISSLLNSNQIHPLSSAYSILGLLQISIPNLPKLLPQTTSQGSEHDET